MRDAPHEAMAEENDTVVLALRVAFVSECISAGGV
jgi:hypothetical protein